MEGKGAGVCFSQGLTRDTEPAGDIHEKVCRKELIYAIWRSDWASLQPRGQAMWESGTPAELKLRSAAEFLLPQGCCSTSLGPFPPTDWNRPTQVIQDNSPSFSHIWIMPSQPCLLRVWLNNRDCSSTKLTAKTAQLGEAVCQGLQEVATTQTPRVVPSNLVNRNQMQSFHPSVYSPFLIDYRNPSFFFFFF